jgi:hypothetical protein
MRRGVVRGTSHPRLERLIARQALAGDVHHARGGSPREIKWSDVWLSERFVDPLHADA